MRVNVCVVHLLLSNNVDISAYIKLLNTAYVNGLDIKVIMTVDAVRNVFTCNTK